MFGMCYVGVIKVFSYFSINIIIYLCVLNICGYLLVIVFGKFGVVRV